jgi:hypothetical protein
MSTAALAPSNEVQRSKGLHIGLWVVQVLLALAFGATGFGKLMSPFADLATKMPWTADVGEPLVRFIGASEILGSLGLLLPSITRIKPKLTSLAATGLVTIMVLASLFHASRGEFKVIPANLVLGALAAFVAWGRFKKAPIAPR